MGWNQKTGGGGARWSVQSNLVQFNRDSTFKRNNSIIKSFPKLSLPLFCLIWIGWSLLSKSSCIYLFMGRNYTNYEASETLNIATASYGRCERKDEGKGPCKYKKNIKIQKKFGYDTPHPPTPLSKKKKIRKISKVINHEYLYIEARTKA